MSTRRTPPPRLSPEVYRRRRLVVLTLLLLLVGGLVAGGWWLKNYFFPATESAPVVNEEPTGPTVEQLANPKECTREALELVPSFAADSISAGQAANISLLVRNTGEVPCLVDMSASTVHAVVTSGDDQIWASDHCGAGLPENRRLLLDVDASDTTVISWSGTRSEAGCPAGQPATKPGTYRLSVKVEVGSQTINEEIVFGMH